mgnify:CR=1 FL=1
MRSGVQLLATPGLILQLGDRLTVVGEAKAIENVEKVLGNAVKTLKDPNLAAIFIGIVLGLILGSIPIAIPGISTPVKVRPGRRTYRSRNSYRMLWPPVSTSSLIPPGVPT